MQPGCKRGHCLFSAEKRGKNRQSKGPKHVLIAIQNKFNFGVSGEKKMIFFFGPKKSTKKKKEKMKFEQSKKKKNTHSIFFYCILSE
jgi:hypothetical protein